METSFVFSNASSVL